MVFFSVLCLLCFCTHLFIYAMWPPAGRGLTPWLSFVVSICEFVTSIGILGQVWYLIVSIPDLCTLTYLQLIPFEPVSLITITNQLCRRLLKAYIIIINNI